MRVPLSWLREIVELADDAASVAKTLTMAGVGVEGIEDDVLVLEITSNRADLLSIVGVARELALLRGARLKAPVPAVREAGPAPETKVEVVDSSLCPRYTARVVRGVKVAPAPAWMQQRLKAALGEEYVPINNVADITNYVMLEMGEPLHAFDARCLRGNKIVVRAARAGERMVAINGREYALEKADLVIADAERPVAIAGVMGGKESEIGGSTRDVLIEAAMFDPVSVRRTSRRLGVASESSYRFERGVDWETVELASRRTAQLVAELAGGTVAPGAVDVSVPRPEKKSCAVRFERVRKLLGMEVASERIRAIVEGLGAKVERADGERMVVRPPAHRRDLAIEVDFIEEIARIEGYDRIPTDVQLGLSVAADRREDLVREEIRSTLTGLGAFEVLTWSFEEAGAKPVVTHWSKEPLLPLRNPKGHVDRTLRNALGPSLLRVLRTNAGCGETLHPVFEIARVYYEPGVEPMDRSVLGIASAENGGLAGVRTLVREVLARLQIAFEIDHDEIVVGGASIGYLESGISEIFPAAAVAELDFDALVKAASLVRKAKPYSTHPAVRRDLSMSFPKNVMWTAIEEAVRRLGIPILHEFSYLNHFEGPQVGEGRRAIAVALTFLAPDRTLTGAEVEAAVGRVAAALTSAFGAARR
ncbi:MAG: phenylalanine--tRNA ligase subunit beta [Planctomycetes bacterium]|nr:phenylalanine--tRNA ligase subunit beta [Planctomycetota bacterium]